MPPILRGIQTMSKSEKLWDLLSYNYDRGSDKSEQSENKPLENSSLFNLLMSSRRPQLLLLSHISQLPKGPLGYKGHFN